MLINAMEVTGIEGTYRCTCESTMDVLRRFGSLYSHLLVDFFSLFICLMRLRVNTKCAAFQEQRLLDGRVGGLRLRSPPQLEADRQQTQV